MTLESIIQNRNIDEVLHFTTNHGCLGSLYTDYLQSRQLLEGDELVKYLFKPNSSLRKDPGYINYVSLSISHINHEFFQISSNSWHRNDDIFWCIMSFTPDVLLHDDVEFATTNNIYSGVIRGKGEEGFDRLFSPRVTRWNGNIVHRLDDLPPRFPTCFQAEALYPMKISTEHLQRIYVRTVEDQSEIIGFLKATLHRDVDVLINPEKFGERQNG
ncbi:DarT ssDNA thymidine ADP-ribosyltransferase family protein [Brucella sp. TWI432]